MNSYQPGTYRERERFSRVFPNSRRVTCSYGKTIERKSSVIGQTDFKNKQNLPFAVAAQELEQRLSETVRICLKSDVEEEAFLSGGIDSSILVARLKATRPRFKPFRLVTGARQPVLTSCITPKLFPIILEPAIMN